MKRVTNMKVRSIWLDQNQVNTPRTLPLKHSTIIPVMVKIAKQQEIRRCSCEGVAVAASEDSQGRRNGNMALPVMPASPFPLHNQHKRNTSALGKTCKDLIYRRLEHEMVHTGDGGGGKTGTWKKNSVLNTNKVMTEYYTNSLNGRPNYTERNLDLLNTSLYWGSSS